MARMDPAEVAHSPHNDPSSLRMLLRRADNSSQCVTNCPVPQCPSTCPQEQKCVFVTRTCGECSKAVCLPVGGESSGSGSSGSPVPVVVGGVLGVFVIAVGIYAYKRYRRKSRSAKARNMPLDSWKDTKNEPVNRQLYTGSFAAMSDPRNTSTSAIVPIGYVPPSTRGSSYTRTSSPRLRMFEDGMVSGDAVIKLPENIHPSPHFATDDAYDGIGMTPSTPELTTTATAATRAKPQLVRVTSKRSAKTAGTDDCPSLPDIVLPEGDSIDLQQWSAVEDYLLRLPEPETPGGLMLPNPYGNIPRRTTKDIPNGI
ncbi:uncharacterized protein VTP21DRAFT_9971 [Calcarisporiella thermophila]|uniref:uncharacterized protein n=1 Tax=Calcarisporiella thermophila TaxID=911321 RepID=UPI0037436F79